MNPAITSFDQLDSTAFYTYADYLKWKFTERVELIKGKVLKMSPAPSRIHQEISLSLTSILLKSVQNEACKLYVAPFDVRLINFSKSTKDQEISTVVQPDLCIICDRTKLDDRGCIGAPDLIIEILSPGNSKKEMGLKFNLYQENGVREYWMVDPTEHAVYMYILENGKYIGLKPFIETDLLESTIFPEVKFEVKNIFES